MEEMPMNIDHKKPENRPLYIFALIAVVVILFLNIFAIPAMQERSVEKTDYSTFLSNVERGNVSKAEVQARETILLLEQRNNGMCSNGQYIWLNETKKSFRFTCTDNPWVQLLC